MRWAGFNLAFVPASRVLVHVSDGGRLLVR
jgi:hypothetical protein